MSAIIELRKQELTTQITEMISAVQFFIDNKKRDERTASISRYLDLNNYELKNVKNTLQTIKDGMGSGSDHYEAYEKCINQLGGLQGEIKKIQIRGEAENRRLERNATSARYAATWAGIMATLGGVALGCGGYNSCMAHNPGPFCVNGCSSFNTITGLLIGAIGGAAIGALIGALMGQTTDRESGDSASGLWLSSGGIVILIGLGIWMVSLTSDNRPLDPTGRFAIVSECNTPCRMNIELKPNEYFNTDQKKVFARCTGKKEWVRIDDPGFRGFSRDNCNPGIAEFVSPENTPSVRVQVLEKK